jgi:hypothetical protein
MKKLMFVLFLFTSGSVFAQVDYQINSALEFFRSNKIATGDAKYVLTEKDIKGSPYLNDEFITGSLYTTSKVQYVDIPFRYNIYSDEMEFKSPDNKAMVMTTPEIIDKIIFGKFTMEYVPYESASKLRHGYFEVLVKGKASVYVKPDVIFQEAVPPGAYKEAEPARFIRRADAYFIRIGQEAAVKVDNKKELIAAFPDKQEKIESFIKKNKIGTKDPEDLIKVAEYYNSL